MITLAIKTSKPLYYNTNKQAYEPLSRPLKTMKALYHSNKPLYKSKGLTLENPLKMIKALYYANKPFLFKK